MGSKTRMSRLGLGQVKVSLQAGAAVSVRGSGTSLALIMSASRLLVRWCVASACWVSVSM